MMKNGVKILQVTARQMGTCVCNSFLPVHMIPTLHGLRCDMKRSENARNVRKYIITRKTALSRNM